MMQNINELSRNLTPETCLAVYGSLAPGRINYHKLEHLGGEWYEGTVKGHLVNQGWGDELGYPAIVLDPDAEAVPVWVLLSDHLQNHWETLDKFEGSEYHRIETDVETKNGIIRAYIYALNKSSN